MLSSRRRGWPCILALLSGCATEIAPNGTAPAANAPTVGELSDAMAESMPPLVEDGASYFCAIATDLQCSPTGRQSRFRCSYDAHGKRRTTVIEQNPPEQGEYRGQWRWVSGWRRCGIVY